VLAVVLAMAALVAAPASAVPGGSTPAVAGAWAPAAVGSADKATRFHVAFELKADGSVDVTENITWQFPSGEERHGIERLIKVRAGYQDRKDTYRLYDMSGVSAQSPSGAPSDVSTSSFGAYERIRVGDPSRTVSGTQTYVVRYTLAHYVNGFPDHAELYFNLVDTSNENTYENVSATVHGPAPVDRTDCFYGELGSTQRCQSSPGESASFSAGTVTPRQAVSILASLPRSAFGSLEPDLREGAVTDSGEVVATGTARALGALSIGAGVVLPVLAAALMGFLVWTRGRDERYAGLTPGLTPAGAPGAGQQAQVVRGAAPTVAVQFTPPAGVQPGMLGTVVDETANTVDVAATVVDLAVRGHLTMEERERSGFGHHVDWMLRRTESTREDRSALHLYERRLLDGIFAGRDAVLLSELKNEFKPTLDSVQSAMYDEVVARGWFRRSPRAQRAVWTTLGQVLVFGGILGTFWFGSGLSSMMAGSGYPVPPAVVLAVGVVLAGGIFWLLGRRMAARTAEGSAVLAQSLGFREYLVTAEASQIRWEEAQEIFSRYLPYAIVFGVAEKWAKTFEQVAAAAAAAGHTVVAPWWYAGPGGFGSFTHLASGMDSFATTAGGTFTSTPGSSGSSGFSAGGGFSGGGGGGSSGGSW
jgi:uncharacterized membrane protein YgcG